MSNLKRYVCKTTHIYYRTFWQVENLNKNCIKIIHFPLLSDIFRARNFAFAIENIEHAYNFKSHWIPPEFDLKIFSILLFQFALGIVCFNDVDRLLQLKFSCTRNSIFENLNLVEISQVKCLILSSGVQLAEHRHKRSYTWNTKCIFFFFALQTASTMGFVHFPMEYDYWWENRCFPKTSK